MTLGSRIAVMHGGAIEQAASPLDTFERPATAFVARFVGSPAMNLWPGRLSRAGALRVTTPVFAATLDDGATRAAADGIEVTLGIRPHDLLLAAPGDGEADGVVEVVEPLGAQATLHVCLAGATGELTRVQVAAKDAPRPGARVGLRLARDRAHLFDAATGLRL